MFRDGFFHADMHPGNIFVAIDPANHGKYIALDFGIMGTLSERDKSYLAQNFLAFFRRDYHRVATAHIESGWVPADTRVDELESEIRVVLRADLRPSPLKEISLGRVLVQLFRASRRFNVEIQPQLVLLQKTLLERRGPRPRSSIPDLDLWVTAKPFLERWMDGPDRLARRSQRRLLAEAPYIVSALRRSCRASCTRSSSRRRSPRTLRSPSSPPRSAAQSLARQSSRCLRCDRHRAAREAERLEQAESFRPGTELPIQSGGSQPGAWRRWRFARYSEA